MLLYNPEADMLRPTRWVGWGRENMVNFAVRPGEGVAGTVFSERRVMVVPDVQSEPLFVAKDEARRAGITSMIGVPLVARDEPLGVLGIYASGMFLPDGSVDEGSLNLLTLFASQVAAALQNARLHHETRRQEREARLLGDVGAFFSSSIELERVLQRVAQRVTDTLGDWCLVHLLDEDRQTLRLAAAYHSDAEKLEFLSSYIRARPIRRGDAIAGRVLETGEPVVIPRVGEEVARLSLRDAEDVEFVKRLAPTSYMAVPLVSRGRSIGVLVIAASRPHVEFDAGDLRLATSLADRAAVSLDNALLYLDEREARKEMETLQSITAIGVSSTGLQEAVDGLLEAFSRMLDADRGEMYVWDEEDDRLVLRSSVEEQAGGPTEDRYALRRLVERAAAEQRPLTIPEPVSGSAVLAAAPDHVRTQVAVPLVRGGRAIGVIGLSVRWPRPPAAEDVRRLEAFGQRATLVLTNMLLYDELERANRLKDEFLSIASHELRTPITLVKGYAQLLLRRQDGIGGEARGILQRMERSVAHMSDLVGDLLDASRIQQARLRLDRGPLDLVALVRAVVEEAQMTAPDHRYRLDAPREEIRGRWDGTRLSQVVRNLVDNAVNYSPAGSEVRVAVRRVDDGAEVSVADRGVGMTEEVQRRLFQRFFRGGPPGGMGVAGLGLGLYISREIVELHGGRIWLHSREGEGTTVTFVVPLTPPEGDQKSASSSESL